MTPADRYYGRDGMILEKREKVRKETMKMRKELNRMAMLEPLPNGISSIIMRDGIRSLRNQHANPKTPDDVHSYRAIIKYLSKCLRCYRLSLDLSQLFLKRIKEA